LGEKRGGAGVVGGCVGGGPPGVGGGRRGGGVHLSFCIAVSSSGVMNFLCIESEALERP